MNAIDPADIAAQRAKGWPDFHPEDYCHECGRPNPVWTAPAAEWSATRTSDYVTIRCPSCFAAACEKATGRKLNWEFRASPQATDVTPVTAQAALDRLWAHVKATADPDGQQAAWTDYDKVSAALAASSPPAPDGDAAVRCDGSRYCPALSHIEGCFWNEHSQWSTPSPVGATETGTPGPAAGGGDDD